MQNNISIGGARTEMAPLISFETIFDLDFGLINLIYDQYLDSKVFNVDFFKQNNTLEIISKIYNRKEKNPLYLIANNDQEKEKLDSYYHEFLETKIDNIYEMCITTSVLNLIDMFNNSQDIKASIVYYDDKQLQLLNQEFILNKNRKIDFRSLPKEDMIYNQLWIKDFDTLYKYESLLKRKSIYISTFKPNFGENDLIDPEFVNKIIKLGNTINIFDMYSQNR